MNRNITLIIGEPGGSPSLAMKRSGFLTRLTYLKGLRKKIRKKTNRRNIPDIINALCTDGYKIGH